MKLENDLKENVFEFKPYFHARVLASLNSNEQLNRVWFRMVLVPSVLCLVFLLGTVLIQNGTLSLDSIMGLSDVDYTLTDYLIYY